MTSIGIDISIDCIKLIEIKKSALGNTILNYGIKELPLNPTNASITTSLIELINETPIHKNEAKISVSGESVKPQFAVFPDLPKKELISLVKKHFEKLVPFPPSECIVDLDIINKEPDNNLNILIISAKKEYVEDKISILENANLIPTMICVDGLALHKLFVQSKHHNSQKNYAILNINEDKTNLIIISNSNPVFIADIIKPANSSALEQEIKNNIDSALEKYKCDKIDEIYLCGNLDSIVELEKHIYANNSNIAYRWNPLHNYKTNSQLHCPEDKAYKLALALAIANS